MIYFDNAATTLHKPEEVIEAVINAMKFMGNAGRGSSTIALSANRAIYNARENIASFFGISDSSRLAFTSNSTEALNTAIKGVFESGDHIITTVMEHNSVLRPLYEIEKTGVELDIITCDVNGNLKYEDIEKAVRCNTKAIVCTHGSNLTGNLIDIEKIASLCKKHHLIFILDASQTAGVFPIAVEKTGIDILCFTGHKSLYGPQGTGGIYVREGIDIRALKSGGTGIKTFSKPQPDEMPTHLEAGTLNGHGIVGLSAGVDFIRKVGIEEIRNHESQLMWKFYNGIKNLKNIKIYGDFSTSMRAPIVTFNIGDYDSSDVAEELIENFEICCRAGGHCAPLMHCALGTDVQGAVRFSFSYFNTIKEVECAINAIKKLADL
ncbi:aminotransferase class V-fold PLP-dependent enzyme [Fusobacterium sp.]|uniref:aminotransferase class V-fold PLP-dependent enzyme n=1 Tax=Fusobacterium sp. TaxID=68766 RepID=UPI00396CF349